MKTPFTSWHYDHERKYAVNVSFPLEPLGIACTQDVRIGSLQDVSSVEMC